jgi:hypothetical protein
MATEDDDYLAGAVPEPEAEASATERAHAKTFAELVDKTLLGRTPPAMRADDRALVEVATMIRAASGNVELSSAQQRSAVEDALSRAIGGGGAAASTVVPIARRGLRRWAPWTFAGASALVAAAAVAALWLRPPARAAQVRAALPEAWRSRPADRLVGEIQRERAGDAGARIDTIFADRLDGYRERRLGGGNP